MARRRSRSSRVSRKRSRRGRGIMNRSKVSRKRSRVSRKRSRVSRKRSRVSRKGRKSRTIRYGGMLGRVMASATGKQLVYQKKEGRYVPVGSVPKQDFRELVDRYSSGVREGTAVYEKIGNGRELLDGVFGEFEATGDVITGNEVSIRTENPSNFGMKFGSIGLGRRESPTYDY